MGDVNPKVDAFINRETKWKDEFRKLRMIALDSPLTEELKWGVPCYTYRNKNVVLMHGFNEYCALLFIKGSLMADTHGILIQQTENVQGARQARFTTLQEIVAQESVLKEYIHEAIKVEESGAKVVLRRTEEYSIPDEFLHEMEENPSLEEAFHKLTPGRQRGYLLFFAAPKQSKTRISRIQNYTSQILAGKGLND